MHIVWDWNGTLLDDLDHMVDAVNHCRQAIGEPGVDAVTYRQKHCLPSRVFHDRLNGRPVTDDEWTTIQKTFAQQMVDRLPPVRAGVAALLFKMAAQGHSQSLLSLTADAQLRREVARTHLNIFFQRIDGRHEPDTPKSVALSHHLAALGEPDRRRVVLIGDTADDAEAARACGVRAVLHSGGFELPESLRAAGVPVVDSLNAAARRAVKQPTRATEQPSIPDIGPRHDARRHR
ncbi:HAD hydrolase-like protein [Streptomyces griseus]|uniref:HAD family hydrolase n=1 Tax=Streptomyces griseus TaxID=1911 RepID=UPI0038701F18|nr:HAD hydrolase-like protein [Streptomyces fimicarius]